MLKFKYRIVFDCNNNYEVSRYGYKQRGNLHSLYYNKKEALTALKLIALEGDDGRKYYVEENKVTFDAISDIIHQIRSVRNLLSSFERLYWLKMQLGFFSEFNDNIENYLPLIFEEYKRNNTDAFITYSNDNQLTLCAPDVDVSILLCLTYDKQNNNFHIKSVEKNVMLK